jgi:ketosteroid isomerase-like protein
MALADGVKIIDDTEATRVVAEFSDLFFFKKDKEAASKLLAPDMVLREAEGLPYGGVYNGIDGFEAMTHKLHDLFEMQFTAEYRDAGDVVLDDARLTMTSRKTGNVLQTRVIELWAVQDGLVKSIDVFYHDTKAIADLAA